MSEARQENYRPLNDRVLHQLNTDHHGLELQDEWAEEKNFVGVVPEVWKQHYTGLSLERKLKIQRANLDVAHAFGHREEANSFQREIEKLERELEHANERAA